MCSAGLGFGRRLVPQRPGLKQPRHEIDNFFPNCVMSSREIVCCIFLARDELLWMEELPIGAGANFVHNSWFQIDLTILCC